jgi:hypothetical protein
MHAVGTKLLYQIKMKRMKRARYFLPKNVKVMSLPNVEA